MSDSLQQDVVDRLDIALERAERAFAAGIALAPALSPRMRAALDVLDDRAEAASAAFTNIVTCLAIKAARPSADVRYHQTQIQNQTSRPAGVNFRGLSEDPVYPWLSRNMFNGAKSGWQTRTLERPKPYRMDYDENIQYVKSDFLTIFDELEEKGHPADCALAYLVFKQVVRRESVRITLSVPRMQDISMIVSLLHSHFFRSYKGSRGASRLPVLALHAIYGIMVPELKRYAGCSVRPLNEHSAADSQTGSTGDIEVEQKSTGSIFEAVEVKHNMVVGEATIAGVRQKVMARTVQRYYVLTTHSQCEPDDDAKNLIRSIGFTYKCQVIVNGVIPTIRYYLRLLEDPSLVLPAYVELLKIEKAIAHEHRTAWNQVVMAAT